MAVKQHGADKVHAVSFAYGQKHEEELNAAIAVSNALELESHRIVKLPREAFEGAGSALIPIDGIPMPNMTYAELDLAYGVSPTYVPYRNGVFLSLAGAFATALSGKKECNVEVWFGAHADDANNWAYPDCTPEFIGSMANALYVGSYFKVRLITPVQWETKAAIVEIGMAQGAPFELTLSCYEGLVPACGVCPTCVSRLHAFRDAREIDPILYAPEAIRVDMERGYSFHREGI
jgi:7-cyano-7-deazaguanine synthase